MPKINRIRICNVTYDGKRIVDEMYTTYDGENILLNLANGSGKSVLVQLMLQPVLPKARIHGRNMEYYLSTNKSPSYIMLEWKLDNTPQPAYFMTGIAMCLSGSNDDSSSRIKYFTFTNDYSTASGFDIANIPFVEKEGQEVKFCSYDTAMKLIRQSEEDRLGYFPSDQREEYSKLMAQHGVFIDEWKIITRINEKEGGVDEIFEKCRTSDTLINDWILKTITDSMTSSGNLQEMFTILMKSIMEQQENIHNKELLTNFDRETKEYETLLDELLKGLSAAGNIREKLYELYWYCEKQRVLADAGADRCREKLTELRSEEDHIAYERLSEAYYNQQEDYENLKEDLAEKQALLADCAEQARDAHRKVEIYLAGERFRELQENDAELRLWEEKSKDKAQAERGERLQNAGYTLLQAYNREIGKLGQEIIAVENTLSSEKQAKEETGREMEQLAKEIIQNSRDEAQLETSCRHFLSEEEHIFKTLGIFISRLLNGRLDEAEVNSLRRFYEEQIQHKNTELASLLKRQEEMDREIAEISDSILDCNAQAESFAEEIRGLLARQDVFIEKHDQLLSVLQKYEIAPEREFDKAFNLLEVKERKQVLEENQRQFSGEIDKQRELLSALRRGVVHTSMELAELLQKEGIEFETGEQYLNKEKDQRRSGLLAKNPVLPYCYLVPEKDMKRVMDLKLTEPITRAIPILAFENLEEDLHPVHAFVAWNKGLLACSYHGECFDNALRQEFEARLERELKEMEGRLSHQRKTLEQMAGDLQIIEAYPYHAEDRKNLEAKLKQAETDRNNAEMRLGNLRNKKEALNKEKYQLPGFVNECRGWLDKLSQQREGFESYLLRNQQYLQDQARLDQVKGALLEMEKHRKALSTQADRHETEIARLNADLVTRRSERRKYEERLTAVSSYDAGCLLAEDIPFLEKLFADLQKEQSASEQEIRNNLQKLNVKKIELENKLKRFAHIPAEQYQAITLDDDILIASERREKETARAEEAARDEASKAETQAEVAKTRREETLKKLKEAGHEEPLLDNEIKRNYEERLSRIGQQKEEAFREAEEQEKKQKLYQRKQMEIERTVELPAETRNLRLRGEEYEAIDIRGLSKALKTYDQDNVNLQRRLFIKYLSIKNDFEGKHPVILHFLSDLNMEKLELVFDEYYYIYERLTESRKKLQDYIQVIDNALRMVEEDKNHVIQHALEHGKKLYQEMQRISKSSYVRLEGRKTPQQMLLINIPEELDSHCEERIREHIGYCIEALRNDCLSVENMEEMVKKKVQILLSDRKIFNVVINKETLKVKLYKVDLSADTSELRVWEEVIVGNSGGQKFVACFAMISALVDYTRVKAMEAQGEVRSEGSKVFIIDNPFGKTSSPHLLNVLIKIAERFNSQMICLSDLSQSSITNRFPVIYQLALRQARYSSQVYLQTGDVRTIGEVYRNERLEHAYVRTQQVQMSLF